MNLNELAKEVYKNSVNHGFWEKNRDFGETTSLIHSELSEALEEYRNDRRLNEIYGFCKDCGIEQPDVNDTCDNCYKPLKPEGIPIELGDAVIRILDVCGKENVEVDSWVNMGCTLRYKSFADFISKCHSAVSKSYDSRAGRYQKLVYCISLIYSFCRREGIDIDGAIKIKHEYNKTRPYKHGKII